MLRNIIPGITQKEFDKIVKDVGGEKVEMTAKVIKVLSSVRSASGRKSMLMELADRLSKFGAEYSPKVHYSSAGHIIMPGGRVTLKPYYNASTVILKPNLFGKGALVDEEIPFKSYFDSVVKSIRDTPKLTVIQQDLLIKLTEMTAFPSSKTQQELRVLLKQDHNLHIPTITNDFGEILGPLGIRSNKLLPIDFSTAKVFIPGRSNEPLIDYRLDDAKRRWKISAKSGSSSGTNTLKPRFVLKLIKDDPFYYKKWKNTEQFKILEILDRRPVKTGPIEAGMWAKHRGLPGFEFINSTTYDEEKRQESEIALVELSKSVLDFTDIFNDATSAKIYYVKFSFTSSGYTKWKISHNTKEDAKKIVFRTKNYVGRPRDKLGLQP